MRRGEFIVNLAFVFGTLVIGIKVSGLVSGRLEWARAIAVVAGLRISYS